MMHVSSKIRYMLQLLFFKLIYCIKLYNRDPHGVAANVLDCAVVVSEFEPQSCYYDYFRTNTLWRGINSLMLPAMS